MAAGPRDARTRRGNLPGNLRKGGASMGSVLPSFMLEWESGFGVRWRWNCPGQVFYFVFGTSSSGFGKVLKVGGGVLAGVDF